MKKLFLVLVVLAAGIVATGFTVAKEQKEVTVAQYYYNSTSTNSADENDPSNWLKVTGTPPSCGGINVLCMISAPEGSGDHPDFSSVDEENPVRDNEQIEVLGFKL